MENIFEQKAARIKAICLEQTSLNPVAIARNIMQDELMGMHGPEHHMIDGAAFLTAMHNAGVVFDLKEALDEMERRGAKMPGAICGQWGVCGSASSIGAALSIIHQTGPLSDNEFYKDNLRFTSMALGRLADMGGPRCCKRNAFISLRAAAAFVKERYDIGLVSEDIVCTFFHKNGQCIKESCPFYPER